MTSSISISCLADEIIEREYYNLNHQILIIITHSPNDSMKSLPSIPTVQVQKIILVLKQHHKDVRKQETMAFVRPPIA